MTNKHHLDLDLLLESLRNAEKRVDEPLFGDFEGLEELSQDLASFMDFKTQKSEYEVLEFLRFYSRKSVNTSHPYFNNQLYG